MKRVQSLLAVVLALTAPVMVGAQVAPNGLAKVSDSTAARFVADARTGTLRYRDRAVAIADGYHKVGPELPSMGEHWLNIGLILADSVDAARPPILIYVQTPDGPVLAGAAYTRLLGPGDEYPDAPVGRQAWHEHSGFLDDEALPMHHGTEGSAHQHSVLNGTRLGILHLWMWEANPAGAWVADNWALPFVRAGTRPPERVDAAARALALAADSGRYYLDVLGTVGRLDSAKVEQLRAILSAATAQVRAIPLAPGKKPTPAQLEALRSAWAALWRSIEATVTPESLARVRPLEESWR